MFCFSVILAAPSVHWLDSGSLVASAWTMGVAHPPGEPLWLAFARVAQLVPVGDIAFRASLLSVLCVALCALPLLALLRLSTAAEDGEWTQQRRTLGSLIVLAGLLGFSAQLQAGRAEVYALTTLLLLSALLVVGQGGLRGWCMLGLLLGLGVGLHPLLFAAATPALVLAALLLPKSEGGASPSRRPAGHWILGAGLGGLVGLGVMAWLPLRALVAPASAWGVPDNLSRFLDVVLARNFASNFGGESASLADNMGVVASVWGGELVPCLLLLLVLCFRPTDAGGLSESGRRRVWTWAAITALWMAGNAATILPQNKVFASNPDVLGYLLVGMLGALPLVAIGLSSLSRFAPLLVSVVLLFQVADGLQSASSGNFLARTFASGQSAGIPPGSILMTSGNDTAFTWGYLQRVERRRSDLKIVHRVLLGHPQEALRLGGPERLVALGLEWSPQLRDDPSGLLRGFGRPFFIERRESESAAVTAGQLRRFGLVASASEEENPWLSELRKSVLAELRQAEFVADAEAGLVSAYYLSLWGDSP